jgi:predicted nucleic acid-binding protein
MKVLDSSFCADFLRGAEAAREYRLDHPGEEFVLSSVGYYELYAAAVAEGRDPAAVDEALPWVDHLTYSRAHAQEAARIREQLKMEDRQLKQPTTMVAGVARALDVPLVTAETGVDGITGLEVDNHRELY